MTEAERDEAECQRIREILGDGRIICPQCGATLETYGDACTAPLDVRCPGFNTIENAAKPAKETP